MTRNDLEHIIRAAAAITNEYEIVVVGSQSILGAAPEAEGLLLMSMEADIFTLKYSEKLSDLIDGTIGELSVFDTTYGYYAQGVAPETSTLPVEWEKRLIRIQNKNTDNKVGLCLDPHDMAAAKLVAGREKDWTFVGEMLRQSIIEPSVLADRIDLLTVDDEMKTRLKRWVSNKQ
ncbi:MAG: hypothetical protein M0Z83_00325 [Betaproteobacteria bacterium]|nr:hypothetical protein [Betaproteobacteria bacterium]